MAASAVKRKFERVPFFCEVSVTSLDNGCALHANSFDISLGGVGMTMAASLPVNSLVQVGFHLKNNQQKAVVENIRGRIAYSRAFEDGNYLGVEFLDLPTAATCPELTRKLNSL
jgi:c-di-GMP-binding flagellar brake protein YcgR